MSENVTNTTPQPRLREALERVRPDMAALDASKLKTINLDIQTATATVRGSLAEIMLLRPQIVAQVTGFDVSYLDKLEVFAMALLQANAVHLMSTSPPEALASLAAEGATIRATLLSDATALANRGIINTASLSNLKGAVGSRNLSSDILSLATLLRSNWPQISTKSCVTLAELDRAEVVADQLNEAYGIHEQGPAALATYALERQQAYTLFVNAYDQVRRAISFLRWEQEDVEDIAPSLYAGRTVAKKKAVPEAEAKPAQAAPPVPPTPVTPTPAAAKPAGTAPTSVGLPGADPFAS